MVHASWRTSKAGKRVIARERSEEEEALSRGLRTGAPPPLPSRVRAARSGTTTHAGAGHIGTCLDHTIEEVGSVVPAIAGPQ